MYATRRLISGLALAGLALLQGCAALMPQPPLWQPDAWPLTTYGVEWPAAESTFRLWVAIEAGAEGIALVAFSPQGVKLLRARYAYGHPEEQRSPLRPAGLHAEALLEAWQLAFGEPAAVAAAYGSDCRFQNLADAGRELRCAGRLRARIEAQATATAVQVGSAAVQRWMPLEDAEPAATGSPAQ